jgi:hypothetical protein
VRRCEAKRDLDCLSFSPFRAKLVRVQLSTLCAVCLAPTLRSADGGAALTLILPERSCCEECAPGGRRLVRGENERFPDGGTSFVLKEPAAQRAAHRRAVSRRIVYRCIKQNLELGFFGGTLLRTLTWIFFQEP